MAFKYRVKIKRSGFGDKIGRYYAVPVHSSEISTMQLAHELSQLSSLSEGDVLSTLSGLSGVIKKYLYDGHTVRLDGIGLLSVSASSMGFETPEKCTPRHVKAKKICFRAAIDLKSEMKFIRFEHDKEEE